MTNKKFWLAGALTAALAAPASAHAGIFDGIGSFFNTVGTIANTVWAASKEKAESTLEWITLNSPTYFVWKTVTLPGGACGDGSPYRIFINQSPVAKNTVIFYEPGGACWDYLTCMGLKNRSASNPDGIPRNYLFNLSYGFGKVLGHVGAPLINRIGLDAPPPTRNPEWNYVYMPYCTGDIHSGNSVKTYKKDPNDPASATRTQFFKGHINSLMAADWLANTKSHPFLHPLSKPNHLLMTGQSAGAFGAPANYSWIRAKLNPARSGMLSDSGLMPNIPSPRTSDSKFRGMILRGLDDWNIAGPHSVLARYEKDFGRKPFTPDNVGDVPLMLSEHWPNDRFIYVLAIGDKNIASFANESLEGEPRWTREEELRYMEGIIRGQAVRFDNLPNVGYYIPFERDINESHCMTLLTFAGTRVDSERGPSYDSVNAAVLSALGRTPTPIRAIDRTRTPQSTTLGSILLSLGLTK